MITANIKAILISTELAFSEPAIPSKMETVFVLAVKVLMNEVEK